ncbi:glycosyltransferase [Sphingobium nicotianae]|uniref:Glycosyltransferase n=1 Tax=Sphingobium nicotianae TaxID=2782607 RepID=A0A9X1AJ34_9SPHN|nr:glycosyltransferase [Sphingobium nicotianae]
MPANHILIPIHDFSAGGTELIAFRLARLWLAAGRRVSILAGAGDGPLRARVPEGVEVHILSPERPRSALSRLRLGRPMALAARAIDPDAVFIPGNFHFMLGRALRAALPRSAIVAKASNPVWSSDWIPPAVARALVRQGTNGIDRIIAMAPSLETDVVRYVTADRVAVIDDPFLDDEAVIAARSAASGSGMRLLTVGRLEPQKDPRLAVSTLKALRAQGHDASLLVLGGGPMLAGLQEQIARDALGDHVTLAGYVADPAPYYRAADMLLMSSRFEGVPAVIGEALVTGLPFVATDCSPWLTALAGNHPALGTVAMDRSPDTLAAAVIEQARRPAPSVAQIEAGIGAHRIGPAAGAYLRLFDSLI